MRDDASQRQVSAARPDRSTWLSANAGSGKTKVLTDRVARLLLDGADSQNILCLTYTKAAATEMQNRLFRRLGEWAMLPDATLRDQLSNLGIEGPAGPETLRQARRLFASAIETPGGLKIQTIHSFCSALLRRFPLEAGVTPNFSEMDERAAADLRADVVEEIAAGPRADVLYALVRHYSGETLTELTGEIVRRRPFFSGNRATARIAQVLDLPEDGTADMALDIAFDGSEPAFWNSFLDTLTSIGGKTYPALADRLAIIDVSQPDVACLDILFSEFLYQSNEKGGRYRKWDSKSVNFPQSNHGKAVEALAPLAPDIHAFMERVAKAKQFMLALGAMNQARALHSFANIFLPAYDTAKQLRGLLDFDDLILRARSLLTDPAVAAWVLYRLDGRLDHILVDEAQDTSPAQWQVIECLAREFTSGASARSDTTRTLFVVGDKKQSIYSFQGADPGAFDQMKGEFARRLDAVGPPLQDMEMEYSFRSSGTILKLVDETFKDRDASGFAAKQPHKAFKSAMPGRADLWPVMEKPEQQEDPEWFRPVDIRAANDPATLLARRLARSIREMIGRPLPEEDGRTARPTAPGDILILVQRRSDLFHDIIRECKALGLPVAGADRLKVGAELAVRDIAALLSFLATPEDSLSLATALRSPLFGWTESQLFALAHARRQDYLWAELRARSAEFPETMAVLRDLRDHADYLRPYELIERILVRHDGRRNLLSRLGLEAEDGIDALLAQSMAYERHAVDSLTGFLVWLETDDLEIRRQIDSAGNRIRVMTVHGAKGLESPIVILPDTARRDIRIRDNLAPVGDTVLWRTRADEAPRRIAEANEAARDAETAERDRLLYVAMTRAERWLIVAAAGDTGTAGNCWYEMIREGMERAGATSVEMEDGPILRLQDGKWDGFETKSVRTETLQPPALPGFLQHPAPTPHLRMETLSPSDLGGGKALADERGLDEEAAKRHGRRIHRLLEHLPHVPGRDWPSTAARLLSHGPDAAEEAECTHLLAEAGSVLENPALHPLFSSEALAEVPVTARIAALNDRRIHGTIDRLIIGEDHVLAVDFKTNASVPGRPDGCPDGLLRQMGAYAHALAEIYPGRRIETAILWTRTATLMPLPHDLVTDALRSAQIS